MRSHLTRRELISGAVVAGTALTMGTGRLSAPDRLRSQSGAKRALRMVHVTDIHITPNEDVIKRVKETLDQIYAMDDRPSLIIQGGDAIMDAFAATKDASADQFEAWSSVWKEYQEIPLRNCIGNHDKWVVNGRSSTDPADAELKDSGWPMKVFGMDERYESFENGGWKFLTLDSTRPTGGGYVGGCDEEQMNWLVVELEKTPQDQPILITSHIPILNVNGFFESGRLNEGNWSIPSSWMHEDAMELKNLFWKHPQVKLCLSGHMHQTELIEFNGVGYYCSGAVCGAWWGGRYMECDPGYAVIDLYEDGTYAIEYVLTPEGQRIMDERGRTGEGLSI